MQNDTKKGLSTKLFLLSKMTFFVIKNNLKKQLITGFYFFIFDIILIVIICNSWYMVSALSLFTSQLIADESAEQTAQCQTV